MELHGTDLMRLMASLSNKPNVGYKKKDNEPPKGPCRESDLFNRAKESLHCGLNHLYEGKVLAEYPSREYCDYATKHYGINQCDKCRLPQGHKSISIDSIDCDKDIINVRIHTLVKSWHKSDPIHDSRVFYIPKYTVLTEKEFNGRLKWEKEFDWDNVEEEEEVDFDF